MKASEQSDMVMEMDVHLDVFVCVGGGRTGGGGGGG